MTDGSNLQEGSSGGRKAVRISLTFDDFRSFITQYSSHISMGGMFIGTRSPLPPATLCKLDVKLKDGYSIVSGLGEVVWTRERSEGPDRPPGMGVRFRELEDKSKDLIFAIVDRRLVEGSGADPSPALPGAAEEEIPDLDELLRSAGRRREEAESRLTPPPSTAPAASAEPAESADPKLTIPEPAPSALRAPEAVETRGQQMDLLPSLDDLSDDREEASFGGLLEPAPEEPDFEKPPADRQPIDEASLADSPERSQALDAPLDDGLLSGLGEAQSDLAPSDLPASDLPISDLVESELPDAGPSQGSLRELAPTGWPEPKPQQLPPLELPPLESLLGNEEEQSLIASDNEAGDTSAPALPPLEIPGATARPIPTEEPVPEVKGAVAEGSPQEKPPEGLEEVWSRLDELEEVSRERSLDPGALPGSQREVESSPQVSPSEISAELLESMESSSFVEDLEPERSAVDGLAAEIELPGAVESLPVESAEDLSDVPPWQGGSGGGYYASQPRRSKALWWLVPVILVLLAALAWAMGLLRWPQGSSSSDQPTATSATDVTGPREESVAPGDPASEGTDPTSEGSSEAAGTESSSLTAPEIITPDIESTTPGSSASELSAPDPGVSDPEPATETPAVDAPPSSGAETPRPTPVEPTPRTPMTRVTGIDFQELQGATRLVITTNGRIDDGRFKYVRIEAGSPRLLIRLLGIEQGYPKVAVPMSTSEARQARIGFHPDRGQGELHVVVDLANPSVQAKSVERQGAKLVVTLE
ncbi:MAG: PilZ domain-containing protein [Deltaproteobacteria bacterium]|nr:PilZ domain-containing protein [Deltaproteobacteria bacterium]